jgi:hypothetical protein
MSTSESPLLPREDDFVIDLTDSPPSSPTASRFVISLDEEEVSMDPLLILEEMEEKNASEVVHHLGSLTCTVSETIAQTFTIYIYI